MKKLSTKQTPETPKKVTLKELIERADKIKNRKKETRDFYIKSLDGVVTCIKPDKELIAESYDMDDNEGDAYIIYNCMINPNLKDKELHKAFGVVNPLEIVDAILEPGEVANLSRKLVEFAGYVDSVKMVDEIKN